MKKQTVNLYANEFFTDQQLPVQVLRREPQLSYPDHSHDFSELVIIENGDGIHCTESGEYPITKGDVFIIREKLVHGYRKMQDLHLINILFHPYIFELPLADLQTLAGYHMLFTVEPQYRELYKFDDRLRLTVSQLKNVLKLVKKLECEASIKEPGYIFMTTTHFMHLVGTLSRYCGQMKCGTAEFLLRIGNILGRIERNFNKPLTLPELAKFAHMSERNFLRAFRKTTGLSPVSYILKLRIKKACELLHYTSLNITEIAFSVGFNDSNYFSRKFKQETGRTPRNYRQQCA